MADKKTKKQNKTNSEKASKIKKETIAANSKLLRHRTKEYSELKFETTADIKVPEKLIDQVIGQDKAVNIIKKAAFQRRHVLLIGEPGTGKSMLGKALAELLPTEKLKDVLSFPNPDDENTPLIRTVDAKQGRALVEEAKANAQRAKAGQNIFSIIIIILSLIAPWWARAQYHSDIMFGSFFIGGMILVFAVVIAMNTNRRNPQNNVPKLIVDNSKNKIAPFMDATGAHEGALFGDVLHDPFQTGGLGTPAHERVIAGLIHKANGGVLFIDEISTLSTRTQQELLTALQDKEFAITGRSERSAGAMVRTEPVPCDFILIAAGNYETVKHMHPALRSRIIGYGYEISMEETMKNTDENRLKLARFVAQEVKRDGKIPHFSRDAVIEIIEVAKTMANRKNHLTLRLRELGGIVRAAGDLAKERGHAIVLKEDVVKALNLSRPLEQQIADSYIERRKEYQVILTSGEKVGRVNGLAVMGYGTRLSGIVLPIESVVTKGNKENKFIATGKLGDIAKEAVTNVSAIIKKVFDEDINNKDMFIQFLQTYEGVEGDSASIAIAVSIISAIKRIPIRQDIAITGSLSVRGNVLPVGGVTYKVKAAIEAGLKEVIIPKSNLEDIVLDNEELSKIKIIPVNTIDDVLKHAFKWKSKEELAKIIKKFKKELSE